MDGISTVFIGAALRQANKKIPENTSLCMEL